VRNRPSPESPRLQWLARAVAVLVTAAVLMTGTGIAQAAFTARTSSQFSASTLNLSTLTDASLTVTCPTISGTTNLKIQLTKPVDKATGHTLTVKTTFLGYTLDSNTVELTATNPYQVQTSRLFRYTYEISAYYDVKVNQKTVNTWVGDGLSGAKTC
jgi:hypothetical protein